MKQSQLQAERRGLCVNPMRSADNDGVLELTSALFQHIEQAIEILKDNLRRIARLQRHGGVQDIGRSQAEMEETGCRTDVLGDRRRKGDDVVLHFGFDLVDAIYRE